MDCSKGCATTVLRGDGASKEPVRMYKVETQFTPYWWWRCPACGFIEFVDKKVTGR